MDRSNLDKYLAENMGMVHQVARQGYNRMSGIGAAVGYDDLVQEMVVTLIRCYDQFDEALGLKFSTYFYASAHRRINKLCEPHEKERIDNGVRSFEELTDRSDSEMSFQERVSGTDRSPQELLEAEGSIRAFTESLSPLARNIVEMSITPPPVIEREFEAATAHAEFARNLGIPRRARTELNVQFVCSVLQKTVGISSSAIRAARTEIEEAARRNL